MKKNNSDQDNPSIKNSAILNVFMIILGSVGGIASLIAFFLPAMRCYNRLSVFIAFYSLFIIAYYLDYMLKKYKLKNIGKMIIVVILGMLAALDQTGTHNAVNNNNSERWYSHRDFVRRVEEITPAGSMIFQLPFVPSDHITVGPINMGMFEHFSPFVHSKTLRWSYRAMFGSSAERWQLRVASGSVQEMLKHLAGVGFKGLYVDTWGFTREDYNRIREEIITITGVEPIISNCGRMEYFFLGEYFANLRKAFSEIERKLYADWENDINIIIPDLGVVYDVSNFFGGMLMSGWSHIEPWGVWSDGSIAQIRFAVLEKSDLMLNMNFHTFPNPLYFSIEVNGIRIGDYAIGGFQELAIPIRSEYFEEENGVYSILLQFNIQNPQTPGADTRMLGIGLLNYTISWENDRNITIPDIATIFY